MLHIKINLSVAKQLYKDQKPIGKCSQDKITDEEKPERTESLTEKSCSLVNPFIRAF